MSMVPSKLDASIARAVSFERKRWTKAKLFLLELTYLGCGCNVLERDNCYAHRALEALEAAGEKGPHVE